MFFEGNKRKSLNFFVIYINHLNVILEADLFFFVDNRLLSQTYELEKVKICINVFFIILGDILSEINITAIFSAEVFSR